MGRHPPFINVEYIRSTGPLFTVPPFFGAMVPPIHSRKGSNGVPAKFLRGGGLCGAKGGGFKRVRSWVIALSTRAPVGRRKCDLCQSTAGNQGWMAED